MIDTETIDIETIDIETIATDSYLEIVQWNICQTPNLVLRWGFFHWKMNYKLFERIRIQVISYKWITKQN